ncbi:MAG: hypothetical protein K2K57_14960 [Oscillospiraceae bacterium]|nr:hypothetical protein [Oscillospiraceae bacterium]
MTVSTNNYINTALLQSLAQNKTVAATAVKEELSALPSVGDELVTARKYDTLELSSEYKTEAASKAESISEDKPLSEAERLREMFIHTSKLGDKTVQQYKTYEMSINSSHDDIAEICGAIGKEIDKAYAEGKISEDEFDSLNGELNNYSEFMSKNLTLQKAEKYARDIINSMLNGKFKEHFEDLYKSNVFGRNFRVTQKGIGRVLQFCVNAFDIDEESFLDKIQAIREDKESNEDYIAKWKINDTEYSGHLASNVENDLKYTRIWYDGFNAGKSWGMIIEENSEKENNQE